MFFFVGRKKLQEMETRFTALCEAVDACQTQLAALQAEQLRSRQTAAQEAEKQAAAVRQEIEGEAIAILQKIEMQAEREIQELQKLEAGHLQISNSIAQSEAQITEDVQQLGKELAAKLAQLDESARLLLLHTVIEELGQE